MLYQPSTVANFCMRPSIPCAMIAGGVGKIYVQLQKISPRVMDGLLLTIGFRSQQDRAELNSVSSARS
ncbi:MAG: hypothetical protein CYG59_11250 [Chloroflexi bacterium]|nr:MAG: hypothetical protein CYG59_11250 [Chloroflexota bacterium]